MKSRSQPRTAAALGLALLMAGCALSQSPQSVLDVAVRQGETENTIQVQATNVTDQPRCLRSELLQNPNTQSATIDGRLNGRRLASPPEGYLVPQLGGLETLEPGETVTFRLNLAGQGWGLTQQSVGRILEIKVAVDSSSCSTGSGEQWSWSPWTRLVE